MDDQGSKGPRGEVFTKTIRAGKRTYFFDVKTTRSNEFYLTITESKKRFNQQSGKFYYEKHKLFLYPEDFEKFTNAMQESFAFIESNNPEEFADEESQTQKPGLDDVKFEDLDKENPEESDQEEEGDDTDESTKKDQDSEDDEEDESKDE